jgi:hypothetical protein
VFQRDRYDPASEQGRVTLAHELTHVVQQRSGPVDGTDAGGGIKVSDPSDRFEREAVANSERVMSGPVPVTASPSPAAVQRCDDGCAPASETAAALDSAPVQREAAPPEEEMQKMSADLPSSARVKRRRNPRHRPGTALGCPSRSQAAKSAVPSLRSACPRGYTTSSDNLKPV